MKGTATARRALIHAGGRLFATAFRLIPRRRRFAAAVLAARLLQPFFLRTQAWRNREQLRMDTIRETSLDFVLLTLTRHSVPFDPRITIVGSELLPARGCPSPLLIAGVHTMLSLLISRHFHDAGFDPVVIAADRYRIYGTTQEARVFVPSPTLLVSIRQFFAKGEIVCTLIDRGEAERHNRVVETSRGPLLVSTPLLNLALRQRVPVLFLATTLSPQGEVIITLEDAVSRTARNADELLVRFASFIDRKVYGRPGTASPHERVHATGDESATARS